MHSPKEILKQGFFKTSVEAIDELRKHKPNGLKNFECEIKTEKGKKIIDVPFKIPQAMEAEVEIEIKRLLTKRYIRPSNSSWLDNVRPVAKNDGVR